MNREVPWFSYTISEIEKQLSTNTERGLGVNEVLRRQERDGKNTFKKGEERIVWKTLSRQFKNPLVFILLIAGIVTFALGEYIDMTVIFIALAINVTVDVIQVGRASLAFQKLKESQKKYAFVLRNNKKLKIVSDELVVGDIIFLEPGVSIPADARLIKDKGLFVNESTLTGEWVDVSKDAQKSVRHGSITRQTNMVWMGTLVSGGSAKAVVVAIGDDTQIGKIAESLKNAEEGVTPLQKSIKKLAQFLAIIIMAAISFIIVIGVLGGESLGGMLLVAVAIAVAAIPEGLPAAVTVVLALGMENILKKNGLVRNLLAAETLGSTTVILTDKTGTLTEAKMKVSLIVTAQHLSLKRKEKIKGDLVLEGDERDVLAMAIVTSDAFVEWKEEKNSFEVHGRPVEKAIVLAGLEMGISQENLLKEEPQIEFIPFASSRKLAVSLHGKNEGLAKMIIVGAPEVILKKSSSFLADGGTQKMGDSIRASLYDYQSQVSKGGARMIAVGYKRISREKFSKNVKDGKDFIFGGFIVLDDPIRADVKEAIHTAQGSGIRVIMVTGDHPGTAGRVALDVGIRKPREVVRTGDDIEKMSDKELIEELSKTNVFARVLPDQKLRILKLFKGQNEIVAMTGDGINDAPALRSADIGIALGSGTDVAKEASDLILLDNGFDIIVYAIEEGRRIVDNLKKITAYLLSTGFSEIFVVGAALIVGAPLPLLPAQILWINIIGEGFMNFAFAFEPKEKGLMKRDPRVVGGKILTPKLKKMIFIIAAITGVFLIALYFTLTQFGISIEKIRTIMFIALSIGSIFFSFSLKDLHNPIWKINIFSNKYLIGALIISFTVLLVALSVPFLQKLLSLEPFSISTFFFILGFGFINLLIIEIVKYKVFGLRKKR